MGIFKRGRPKKYWPLSREGSVPPSKPGVYRILGVDDTIDYVGETNNLFRRISEHALGDMIDSDGAVEYQVADGRSTSRTRRFDERKKIIQHRPKLNRSRGGEGRIADR